MCGFLVTNVRHFDIEQATRFQRRRGPDNTNVVEIENLTFVHHLLSITGQFTRQPFVHDGLACVYNGEIYNSHALGEYPSDGTCILPQYAADGADAVRELDGEFALVIVDYERGTILLSTDPFGTKPLHYSVSGSQFGVASYASALSAIGFSVITRLPPNCSITIALKTGAILKTSTVVDFSTRQYKTSFDDWTAAFSSAIRKRASNCRERIFIGLSSGYDSGAIACELDRQRIRYKSFSILNNERREIVEARIARRGSAADFELIEVCEDEWSRAGRVLEANVEPVGCEIIGAGYREDWTLHGDGASRGLAIICEKASREGRRVYLSGQGSDEIFSDYGRAGVPIYPHSNFGGLFPEDLSTIFPWPSVFGSTQSAYLTKEEYVAGSFGIEARYPFLDKSVIQEFLNLSHHLKNWRYKSVLRNLLDEARYPYSPDEKRGFLA